MADLVERLCRHASTFAAGLGGIAGAAVLNDVERSLDAVRKAVVGL